MTRGLYQSSRFRLASTLLVRANLLALFLAPAGTAADEAAVNAVDQQQLAEQATLETRQPEVQWSAAGAPDWQSVPARQTVRAGDRVRTGQQASARLLYF